MCHVSHFKVFNFILDFFLDKVVKLVGGGSGINKATPPSSLIKGVKDTQAMTPLTAD